MKMLYLVPLFAVVTHTQAAPEANVVAKQSPSASAERDPASVNAATDAALSQSSEGLVEVRMPDGSTMIDLQGRFQMTSQATVQADGRVKTDCDTDEAVHAHTSAAPVSSTESNER